MKAKDNSDPLPGISEAAASGRTAVIFGELRERLRVPQVNLIWRCLAVEPAALDWAWQHLRPLYDSGLVWAAAEQLERALPRLPAGVPPAAPVGEAAAIDAVLQAYQRANTVNLLSLMALLNVGQTGAAAAARMLTPAPPPPPMPGSLPALLDVDAMPARLAGLVRACNRLGSDEAEPMMASAWRQLAHWPAFLEQVLQALGPLHAQAVLQAERDRLHAGALAGAAALAAAIPSRPGPVPALVGQTAARFADGPLPRMLMLVALMRDLLARRRP